MVLPENRDKAGPIEAGESRMEELQGSNGCFVCDRTGENPRSLGLKIFWDDGERRSVIPFAPEASWCGFEGFVHGGILTAICDDAMAWAARKETGAWSVTANLSVRFLRSVKAGSSYEARGSLARQDGKKFHTQAVIHDSAGKLCVEAKAVFVEVSEERLFGKKG
jgi:uncharacterized protein (TIGR00369 family)